MSRRRLRSVLLAAVALVALAAAVTLFAWRGEEWLRAGIERRLQSVLGPAVTVAGPVRLDLLPRPAVSVSGLSLRGADGGLLLGVERATVELDRRLLAATPTIAALRLDGVTARLVRDRSGRWNAAGWLRHPAGAGASPPPVRLARLEVSVAALGVEDEGRAMAAELRALRLTAAPLGWGETAAVDIVGDARVRAPRPASGRFRFAGRVSAGGDGAVVEAARLAIEGESGAWRLAAGDLVLERARIALGAVGAEGVRGRFDLRGPTGEARLLASLRALAAAGDGAWRAQELALELSAHAAGRSAEAELAAPTLELRGAAWRLAEARLVAHAVLADGKKLDLQALLAGSGEGAALELRFGAARLALPRPAAPDVPLELALEGDARLAAGVLGGALAGRFDRTRFDGTWRYRPNAPVPLGLALRLDRLDADRYLPPSGATEAPDLDAWLHWPLRVEATVGVLRYRGVTARNAHLVLGDAPTGAGR